MFIEVDTREPIIVLSVLQIFDENEEKLNWLKSFTAVNIFVQLFCLLQEGELMENLFNSLCSLLLEKENRDRFLQGEGIQLMNLMLR